MAGLPEPIRQHPLLLLTGELIHLDIAWPEVRLAVEPGHSWWHGGDTRMAPTTPATGPAARSAGRSSDSTSRCATTSCRRPADPPALRRPWRRCTTSIHHRSRRRRKCWTESRGNWRRVSVRTWQRRGGGVRGGVRAPWWRATATSWVAGDSGAASASLRRPPRIALSRPRRRRRRAGTPERQLRHSTPPSSRSKATSCGRLAVLAATHARVDLRAQPLGGEQLPEERRHDQWRRSLGDRPQRPDHHPIQLLVRLALEGELVGRLEHGHPLRRPVEAGEHRRQRLDGLGLADDVELACRGTAAGARGSSVRAVRRSATSSCARPWRRRGPCRSRRSAGRRCGRPHRACTSAARRRRRDTGG